ncbi:hypothetical protein ABKN59_006463 [Abortiporus biennis]
MVSRGSHVGVSITLMLFSRQDRTADNNIIIDIARRLNKITGVPYRLLLGMFFRHECQRTQSIRFCKLSVFVFRL